MWTLKQTCADCHYLVREVRGDRPQTITLEVRAPERIAAKRGDYSWLATHYTLCCARRVWDEGYMTEPDARATTVARTNRRGRCFFWPFQPGMMLPAALERQDATDKARGRRLTIYGLLVGSVALIVNALVRIAEHRHWWPFD